MTLLRGLGIAVTALLVAGCGQTSPPDEAPEETRSATSASPQAGSQDAADELTEPTVTG